jgi:hypothetical protein
MLDEASSLRERKERLASAIREKRVREERKKQSNPRGGLLEFVRYFWHVLEPVDPFVEGWPIECLCAHLEGITSNETVEIRGKEKPFNRLLANVPPGFMKSLLVQVFWKAWEWGPMGMPHLRYVSFSYSPHLTERDNGKFRNLICSQAYQEMWGHVFKVVGDGKVTVTNDKTGSSFATSFGGVGTGERGHRVILDDPHKLKGTQETTEARFAITSWVREGMQNRLNDLRRDAIVIIMQRLYEDDAAGEVIKHIGDDYCWLQLPMEYEEGRHFSHYTGWNNGEDPREREGQLAWPKRYPRESLATFKKNAYLWAGQYQQTPVPRGGGLFKDEWWQIYEVIRRNGMLTFVPEINPIFVLAYLDTAFSETEENDYNALTVWAVCNDPKSGHRRIVLVDGWQKRLSELHGRVVERHEGEKEGAYLRRAMPKWGLVEWVHHTCSRRRVDLLIIENKTRGHDVNKEIRRLCGDRSYGIHLDKVTGGDKWSRAHSVVDIFTDDMVYAPAEILEDGTVKFLDFADLVIRELSKFPKGGHDDLPDTVTGSLRYLRAQGYAIRREEKSFMDRKSAEHKPQRGPIYDV